MFDGFLGTADVLYQLTLGTLDPACRWLLGALLAHLLARGAPKVPLDWLNAASRLWGGKGGFTWAGAFRRVYAWYKTPSETEKRLMRVELIVDRIERKV